LTNRPENGGLSEVKRMLHHQKSARCREFREIDLGSCPLAWCKSVDPRRGSKLIRRPQRAA
jgi:hypothetical protein